ncbi:MAG: 5-formyltetrahydrofolate cyclo-ligase [SAR324 cluster bacterium]|nr:5-formyltetrahydrofolate cyclo-ligase [SAR324 cluster bacterium]MCH8888154.1 5-formyltetrahydrofolate cyclo-ligase [SAR324 cluster bacterium]
MDQAEHLSSQKGAMRKRIRQLRRGVSPLAREKAAGKMAGQLERLSVFRQAGGVHCFIPLPGEVDTGPIFTLCQALGKRTYVPIQMPGERRLDVAAWRPGDPLVSGAFSVLEPPPGDGVPVDRSGIDLVLAPGLAFDRHGGRLGYGKGYYDGFLAAMAAEGFHPVVIGLAFSFQIVEEVPRGNRDFPVDGILTETGFFEADFSKAEFLGAGVSKR